MQRRQSFAALVFGLCLAVASPAAPARAQSSAPDAAAVLGRKVTVHADNGDLRAVLKQLFDSAHVEYALDPEVRGTVTISAADVPLRVALDAALRAADSPTPLTYQFEDGICRVMARPVSAPPRPSNADEGQGDRREMARIGLKYADAGVIAAIVGGIAVAPDSIVFGGDTSAFGRAPVVRRVFVHQPPDGASYYRSWSLGSGGFSLGPGGGFSVGGNGRGALGDLLGGVLR